MNRKRLRELADVIEGMPYMEVPEEMISAPLDEFPYPAHGRVCKLNAFNMNYWASNLGKCHTAGCVAGWAVYTFGGELSLKMKESLIDSQARFLLGLSVDDASLLFAPWERVNCNSSEITPHHAATALRLVAEGTPVSVAWSEALGATVKRRHPF